MHLNARPRSARKKPSSGLQDDTPRLSATVFTCCRKALITSLLTSLVTTTAIAAGVIRSPVAASANVAPATPGDLQNAINQTGLDKVFVSGSTDFDAYIATTPRHTILYYGYEWFSAQGITSAVLVFDMGQVFTIDRMALWNEESSGIWSLAVQYSTDGVTYKAVAGTLSPTNGSVALGDYAADIFNLGNIAARYIQLNITCPQPGYTYPGCSLGEIAFSTSSASKIEITLSSPPVNDKYSITSTPAMPTIKAKAKVVGVNPDPTPTTTFTWNVELNAIKGTGQTVPYKSYIIQNQKTIGIGEYTLALLNSSSILGGDLILTATTTVNSKEVKGSTPPTLAIHGTNPQRTAIHSRVDTAVDAKTFSGLAAADVKDALKRMACQESNQRQFKASSDGGIGPALISFDNGVGIFQITSGDPMVNKPSVVFDWRANTDEGASAYQTKVKIARSYPASLRKNTAYKKLISETINQGRCTAGLQPIGLPLVPKAPSLTYVDRCLASLVDIPTDAPAADFPLANALGSSTVNMLLEDGVRGYNGYAGPSLYGSVLHEFRPDVDFLVTLPDSSLAGLATNSAIWQRVPVSDRGTSGDPDYVDNVTSKQPTCN